jgi:hypothetical protein
MGQTWANVQYVGELFERYSLAAAFEIGTWLGGVASYLGTWFPFATWTADVVDRRSARTKVLHTTLGVQYMHLNCHDPDAVHLFMDTLPRPAFVFVDGVRKKLEFEIVAPHLRTGDLIGVHDFGSEVSLASLSGCIHKYGLMPVTGALEISDVTHSMYWTAR